MSKNREISPAVNLSADDYFARMPQPLQGIISTIRAEKEKDSRTLPSSSLLDRSAMLTAAQRTALVDKVASLVDENLTGRSDMCLQFALLLRLALNHLGLEAHAVTGTATYLSEKGRKVFAWPHGWVRAGREVIDGNVDSIFENIMVPRTVKVVPYWGPIKDIPGRSLEQNGYVEDDLDVMTTWWPKLENWLDKDFANIA
jgi:hypothetical protein